MTTPDRRSRQLIVFGITVAFAAAVAVWTLFLVRQTLLVLYIAGLLAIGFNPAVRWLERYRLAGQRRWRLPRWAAILILYLAFIGFVVLVFALMLPPLINQSGELYDNLPTYAEELQSRLLSHRLITHQYTWTEILRSVPSPATVFAGVMGALQSVLGAAGALITVVVLPYYLLLESQALHNGFLRLFALERREQVSRLIDGVTGKVSAWLGGQLLLAAIIGTTAGLGLALMGVPYFYVLAVIVGFGELIPVVGPVFAAVPAVFVAATVSTQTAVFVVVYFAVQQFIENHFLVPRIMQRQVGVSAVTVIAALLIGTELLGVVGALLAVPTAAILQLLLDDFLAQREKAVQEHG